MSIQNRLRIPIAIALAMAVVVPQSAAAAQPQKGSMSITGDAHGFTFRSEKATTHGSYVDTFASADSTISVVAQAHTTITVDPNVALPDGNHGFMIGTSETVQPSQAATILNNLLDLGLSNAQATAANSAHAVPSPLVSGGTVSPLTQIPYGQQNSSVCYTINLMSGLFTGYGCGHSYIDWKDPHNLANWALVSNYWVTMQVNSNLGTKLKGVYWRMQWPANNAIQEENPYTTIPGQGTQNCGSQQFTLNLTVPGTNIGLADSYTQPLCADSYGPWAPSGVAPSLSSGARWHSDTGVGTGIGMGVQGDQGVYSPSNAAALPVNNYYLAEY